MSDGVLSDGLPSRFFERVGRLTDAVRRLRDSADKVTRAIQQVGGAIAAAERAEFEDMPDVVELDVFCEAWYGQEA